MNRAELKTILAELVADETSSEVGELPDDVTLRDGLELDSVDLISLVMRIENRLDLEIPSERLDEIETVGDILGLLEELLGPPRSEAA